jgi:hypothetical protein
MSERTISQAVMILTREKKERQEDGLRKAKYEEIERSEPHF